MKKTIFISLLAALLCTSCRYEEPTVSFYSPESRLIGYWDLQNTYKNGVKLTEEECSVLPNKPESYTYYSFFYDGLMDVTSYISGVTQVSTFGTWKFTNKQKDLEITVKLKNRTYSYTAEIIKLSRKELKYRYVDNNGDTWQLEMYSLSN